VAAAASMAAAASTSGRSSEVPSVLARRRRSARCCDSFLRSSPDILPRRDTDRWPGAYLHSFTFQLNVSAFCGIRGLFTG